MMDNIMYTEGRQGLKCQIAGFVLFNVSLGQDKLYSGSLQHSYRILPCLGELFSSVSFSVSFCVSFSLELFLPRLFSCLGLHCAKHSFKEFSFTQISGQTHLNPQENPTNKGTSFCSLHHSLHFICALSIPCHPGNSLRLTLTVMSRDFQILDSFTYLESCRVTEDGGKHLPRKANLDVSSGELIFQTNP